MRSSPPDRARTVEAGAPGCPSECMSKPTGTAASIDVAQWSQVVRQLAGLEAEANGVHPAADIDPDRRRNDRALGGNDRAHGRADADMDIGHRRDMAVDER
jgi:hypothetical protein